MNIDKIISDYVNCDKKDACNECEANKCINDSSHTYCELLSTYRSKLQDKIIEVIEKN